MDLIKPLTLEIDRKIWDYFKEHTPRTITLNEAVVELIISENAKRCWGRDDSEKTE